jgi:hypothetical protein
VGDEFRDDYRKALPKDLVQRLTQRSAWRATAAILRRRRSRRNHWRRALLGRTRW